MVQHSQGLGSVFLTYASLLCSCLSARNSVFFFLELLIICVCAGYAQGTFQRLSTRQHSIKKESKVKGEEKKHTGLLNFFMTPFTKPLEEAINSLNVIMNMLQ